MGELNTMLADVQKMGTKAKKDLTHLLGVYEELFKQSNQALIEERIAANGNIDGYEDFYRLVQIIKRNKDIIGSMLRGINTLRPTEGFKFVEDDVEAPPEKVDTEVLKKRIGTLEMRIKSESKAGNQATVEGLIHQISSLQEKLVRVDAPVIIVDQPADMPVDTNEEGGTIDG